MRFDEWQDSNGVPVLDGTNLAIPSGALPAGTILQVVEGSTTTGVTNNTNVLADTTLTATITPSSTSSKIFVIVSQTAGKNAGNAGSALNIVLLRNATSLVTTNTVFYTNSSLANYGVFSFSKLDSPNTTSPVTYKTQFSNVINAAGVTVQSTIGLGFNSSTIQLLEVAG
jgi:hypothetical protein